MMMINRVWLNSYMEENATALVREINRNIRQTTLKDYNQLKVRESRQTNNMNGMMNFKEKKIYHKKRYALID